MDASGNLNIASLGDIEHLAENLGEYPIQKLNELAVSQLNVLLNVFERNYQGFYGVKVVVSFVDRAVQMYTYTDADWNSVAKCIIMLFHRILGLILFNPVFLKNEKSIGVIQTATKVLQTLGDKTATLNSLFMEYNGIQILQLICWKDLTFEVRKTVLCDFKKLLMKLPAAERMALVEKTSHLMKDRAFVRSSLVDLLLSCGDFEFQECLTEVFVRFSLTRRGWKNTLKSWFSDFPPLVDAVDILDYKSYEHSCRQFLNLVNDSQCSKSRVHSLPCLYAVISGQIELKKPVGQDELWLDCNPRTGEIQLLVDGLDGSSLVRVGMEYRAVQSIRSSLRKWHGSSGKDEECCQIVIDVHPSIVVPFEDPVTFSELLIVLKKNRKFQELENDFFKVIYAQYYEPERATHVAHSERTAQAAPSCITSSSSRKTSLGNVTLSTIERDPSAFTLSTGTSLEKLPRIAPTNRKRILASTPKKRGAADIQNARREIVEDVVVVNETIKNRKDIENVDTISISSRSRTSVSDQITRLASRDLCEADRDQFLKASLHSISTNNALSKTRESTDESFFKLLNEVTHLAAISNGHSELSFSATNIEVMLNKDNMSATENIEKNQIPGFQIVPQTKSHTVGDNPCDLIVSNVEEASSTIPRSENVERLPDSSVKNPTEFTAPDVSTFQNIFGAHRTTPVDFKALEPPPSPVGLPSSTLPFKKKYFGKWRKMAADLSQSDMSLSSCSTKISKRHFNGIVQIKSPAFDLNARKVQRETKETCGDPFTFDEVKEEKIQKFKHVIEDVNNKYLTPTTKERQTKKLYTPGKDDILHSDGRESPFVSSDPQNHKLTSKRKQISKKLSEKCILDTTNDETKDRKIVNRKKREIQIAEGCNTRSSSRKKKKVNYKDNSDSECDVNLLKSCFSNELSRVPASRDVEPLRSEGVALSPPAPSGSAPYTVEVNSANLSPPRYPVVECEPETVQISPPPQIEMVLPPSVDEKTTKKRVKRKRKNGVDCAVKKRRNKKQRSNPNAEVHSTVLCAADGSATKACEEQEVVTQSDIPVENLTSMATPEVNEVTVSCPDRELPMNLSSSVVLPVHQNSSPLKRNGEKLSSVEASSLSAINAISDQVWGVVKTFVNGLRNETNPGIVESIKVNLNTCLATQKMFMKIIHEESLNIARSAANVQNAYDNCMTNLHVVLEMMQVIEDAYRGSNIVASVRNNDPRSYSQLRQQIFRLIHENVIHNPH